jgi:thiol-disulfide isomerase/thioredoxin
MSEGELSRLFAQAARPFTSGGRLPGFAGATGWLNSPPLGEEDLRGRVVLVDFWTYTCINWMRTLAYVRAWAERYADLGLVVVGVHTPEFPFEGEVENVRRAVGEARAATRSASGPCSACCGSPVARKSRAT